MNDPMLMQVTARQHEMMQEAERARLGSRTRRRRAQRPRLARTPGSRLATAIARLRPTSQGRWQAQ
jgi:hypothetical protein